uniref:pyridoxal phosphate-dependent aminotransferase n=1 Tax=Rhodohalobacter halophilus TaxID=1812810 RepID=UPI00114CDA1E
RVEDNSKCLKLDWNESVESHSIVKKALIDFIENNEGAIKWYPDVEAAELRESLSDYLNISRLDISVFGGSDVALETVAKTYCGPGDKVVSVVPSYDNFRVYVESTGAEIENMFFNPIYEDIAVLTAKFRDLDFTPKLIYLNNPNNPIGYHIPVDEIESLLLKFKDSLFIVDEAYIEFLGKSYSAVSLVKNYENIVVARSFSKAFGLAGLRLGYIVTHRGNLLHINKIRNGKNISMFAQIAGKVLIDNSQYVISYVEKVNESKKWFLDNLKKHGITAHGSKANFVLVEVKNPEQVLTQLKRENIYVRNRSHMEGLENMIRITIGNKEVMKRTFEVLKQIIKV